MTYKELMKCLAGYSGDFDDEVIFVNYKREPIINEWGEECYKVTSVGISDGKCRLNNAFLHEV